MAKILIALMLCAAPAAAQYYPGSSVKVHSHASATTGGQQTNQIWLGSGTFNTGMRSKAGILMTPSTTGAYALALSTPGTNNYVVSISTGGNYYQYVPSTAAAGSGSVMSNYVGDPFVIRRNDYAVLDILDNGDVKIGGVATVRGTGLNAGVKIYGDASFISNISTISFYGYMDFGLVRVSSSPAGTTTSATATCPAGMKILGGPDSAYCNTGSTTPLYFSSNGINNFSVYCAAAINNVISGWCARLK